MHRSLWMILLIAALVVSACSRDAEEAAPAAETPASEAGEAPQADAEEAEESAAEESRTGEEPGGDADTVGAAIMDGIVMLPEVDPLAVDGDIITAGSSTVFPLAEAVAERFIDEGYSGNITIDSIGSGAGFSRFCEAGESDIANASRAIKDSERQSCAAIGRDPIEFRVGTDALAIAVNTENDWVTDAGLEEIAAIFTADNWSDVNPDWPNEPILRYVPGTDSGTFDFFVEEIFEEDPEPLLTAADTQFSEDDNVLVVGIQGSPYAVGFFGYAYYSENADALGILDIGGVEPNAASVEDGSYALARPLFIYSDASIMAEKPQVADYINFFLTYVNAEIERVGYFPASDEAVNAAKNGWLAGLGMDAAMPAEAAMESGDTVLPEVDPLAVDGDIITAGSSTVFPLAEAVAERFIDEGYSGNITIDSIGSGAGFSRFCEAGESDIANASRAIKDSERQSCAAIGRDPIEFRVGTDALAIAVNTENDWVTDAGLEEIAAIFTADNWSDVNPDWPDEPILRYVPGTDSGTFDFFVEEIFEEDPEPLLTAADTQFSEDDNVLVVGIQGSPYAVGFFGYAYYSENADALGILDIGGVEPNAASVEDGSYALARPLFIYSDASIMAEKPQVADYINFFLTYVNEEIERVGYFPASNEAIDAAKAAWLAAGG